MLKKNEVLEILEDGGYIYLNDICRHASVCGAAGEDIDTCRYDTAERIGATAGYCIDKGQAWSYSRFISKTGRREEVKAAAAAELYEIRTPGTIELRAKTSCYIGRQIQKGAHYIVTVYSNGTHSQPANAYGTLYDFDAEKHAVCFEIISKPEPAQEAAQNEEENDMNENNSTNQQPDEIAVDDLLEDLDTGDYGEYLNDYRDSSTYICDAVAEIADAHTSIYYSDILDFIRDDPDALADVIDLGLYDPTYKYDLYQHGQAAQYMRIEQDIYEHQETALYMTALHFVKYDLKRETIPGDLADLIEEWAADPGDRMNEIPDRIREYFADQDAEQ